MKALFIPMSVASAEQLPQKATKAWSLIGRKKKRKKNEIILTMTKPGLKHGPRFRGFCVITQLAFVCVLRTRQRPDDMNGMTIVRRPTHPLAIYWRLVIGKLSISGTRLGRQKIPRVRLACFRINGLSHAYFWFAGHNLRLGWKVFQAKNNRTFPGHAW